MHPFAASEEARLAVEDFCWLVMIMFAAEVYVLELSACTHVVVIRQLDRLVTQRKLLYYFGGHSMSYTLNLLRSMVFFLVHKLSWSRENVQLTELELLLDVLGQTLDRCQRMRANL